MSQFKVLVTRPDSELLDRLARCFTLRDIKDKRYFSKSEMQANKTVEKISELSGELGKLYAKRWAFYLSDLSEQRCLTILRHFLRTSGYKLQISQRSIFKVKQMIYRIVPVYEVNTEPCMQKVYNKDGFVFL